MPAGKQNHVGPEQSAENKLTPARQPLANEKLQLQHPSQRHRLRRGAACRCCTDSRHCVRLCPYQARDWRLIPPKSQMQPIAATCRRFQDSGLWMPALTLTWIVWSDPMTKKKHCLRYLEGRLHLNCCGHLLYARSREQLVQYVHPCRQRGLTTTQDLRTLYLRSQQHKPQFTYVSITGGTMLPSRGVGRICTLRGACSLSKAVDPAKNEPRFRFNKLREIILAFTVIYQDKDGFTRSRTAHFYEKRATCQTDRQEPCCILRVSTVCFTYRDPEFSI